MAKLSERIQEQQARRTRRPLPPSHPRPATPPGTEPQDNSAQVIDLTVAGNGDAPAAPSAATEAGPTATPDPAGAHAVPAPAATPRGASSTPATRKKVKPPALTQDVALPLEPRQVWLDRENDLWLSECEYANVRRGGRKVISRSSVVRLALDRLREAMTPEQITDLLVAREPAQQGGRGRPRR
jgi:hypothetical protein